MSTSNNHTTTGLKTFTVLTISVFLLFLLTFFLRDKIRYSLFTPRQTNNPTVFKPNNSNLAESTVEIFAENLDVPWEIAVLPSGNMLVTERTGNLLMISSETKLVKKIEGVRPVGEGGLLGLALHPQFSQNHYLYLYLTVQGPNGLANQIERYTYTNETLTDRRIILTGIKGSANHDGGRIAFGPDGYLYITTGDAQDPNLAQDKNSLNGKILRITDTGGIPSDNPFGNAVYSLGHRNPQGLAWDKDGRLWETEHGPSGLQTGYDEINIIKKAGNYGWPVIKGDENKSGYISPILQSGSEDTWAPSGMAYWNGSLYFGGLRGESLYEVKISGNNKPSLITHFQGKFGRIRAVIIGPDNYLYFSTSNRDGRGQVRQGDDKILRIRPSTLNR